VLAPQGGADTKLAAHLRQRDNATMTSPDDEPPIRYIERTHAWYAALGYPEPYRYAQFDEVPFTPLAMPLAQVRIALLITAAPYRPELGDQSARAPYNAAAKFYAVYSGNTSEDHDLRVSHVSIDRAHLKDDPNCWFPLPALRRAAASGRVGGLTARFHGVPTNRSQRHTLDVDAPEAVRRAQEDGADAAILVANCPICHQTLSLTARALEAAGVPTVVMGAARDIVELCGVPRFLWSDVPLGSSAGLPDDPASQDTTLDLALTLLKTARAPRTTLENPLRWPGPPGWRADYLSLAGLSAQDLARERARNDEARAVALRVRDGALGQEG
jgi:D-proline reductase (dithiol) PrdB